MIADPEAAGPVLTVSNAPAAFHLMAKPTGAICNLDCEYCFFLSKEMLYAGSRFRMADELHETYIRQLIDAHAHAPEVVVAWQGGEPTIMGLDFFRRSIALQRKYVRPGQRILNTLQTNGTLLDDEWADFLKANDFLVGISIDGPRDIHDTYRVDKGGKPTFDRVIQGLDHLKAQQVEWNVLTTVHAANGDYGGRVYRFLRDELGARFIQFIPIVERINENGEIGFQEGNQVSERSVKPEQWGTFLIAIVMFEVSVLVANGIEPDEFLYPVDAGGRFTRDTGVPPIAMTCLPHLTDEPDALYAELEEVVDGFEPAHVGALAGAGRLAQAAEVRPGQI